MKRDLLQLALSELNQEFESLSHSARAAHEAATHEESKAEDAHDTRGVEASYLAGAQSARLENLKKMISVCQNLKFRDLQPTDPIEIGALVSLEFNSRISYYFLVTMIGGRSLSYDGLCVQMITPQSLMCEALVGHKAGEMIEVEGKNFTREYKVVSVC